MKRVIHLLSVLLALALVVQVGFAADKTGPRIEEIRFEAHAPGEEQVIFRLNSICIPKVFAIKGENPRVVFDFPDTTVATGLASTIDAGGRFIRRIRIGLHGEPDPKTRVVLDLVPGAAVEFRQTFDQPQKSLIVSLFRAGTNPGTPGGKTSSSTPGTEKKPAPATEKKNTAPSRPQEPPRPGPASTPPPATRQGERQAAPAGQHVQAPSEQKAPAVPSPAPVQPSSGPKTAAEATKAPATTPAPARPASPDADNSKQAGSEKQQARPTAPAAASRPVLRSITFDRSSNRGEMVLFKLSEFHPPVVFGIEEGLPRVVCDFKGTTAESGVQKKINANGRYVKTIRIGIHRNPDKIRVVLDLAPNNNYDLQQVFFKDDNLFVIIINTINHAPTRQEVERPLAKKPKT